MKKERTIRLPDGTLYTYVLSDEKPKDGEAVVDAMKELERLAQQNAMNEKTLLALRKKFEALQDEARARGLKVDDDDEQRKLH